MKNTYKPNQHVQRLIFGFGIQFNDSETEKKVIICVLFLLIFILPEGKPGERSRRLRLPPSPDIPCIE